MPRKTPQPKDLQQFDDVMKRILKVGTVQNKNLKKATPVDKK